MFEITFIEMFELYMLYEKLFNLYNIFDKSKFSTIEYSPYTILISDSVCYFYFPSF